MATKTARKQTPAVEVWIAGSARLEDSLDEEGNEWRILARRGREVVALAVGDGKGRDRAGECVKVMNDLAAKFWPAFVNERLRCVLQGGDVGPLEAGERRRERVKVSLDKALVGELNRVAVLRGASRGSVLDDAVRGFVVVGHDERTRERPVRSDKIEVDHRLLVDVGRVAKRRGVTPGELIADVLRKGIAAEVVNLACEKRKGRYYTGKWRSGPLAGWRSR